MAARLLENMAARLLENMAPKACWRIWLQRLLENMAPKLIQIVLYGSTQILHN